MPSTRSRPRTDRRRAYTTPRQSSGTAATRVIQSLPYQVALIHPASLYSPGRSNPRDACTAISTARIDAVRSALSIRWPTSGADSQSRWPPTSATRPRDSPALDRNVGGAPRGSAVASGARPGRRLGRGALLARPQPAAHDVAELKDAFVDQRVVDEQPVFPAVHELESVEQLKVLGEIGLVQTGSLAELSDAELAAPQCVEDPQSGRFAKRLEPIGDRVEQLICQYRHCPFAPSAR